MLIIHENCQKRPKLKILTKDIRSSDPDRKQQTLWGVCTQAGTLEVWQECLTKHKFHETRNTFKRMNVLQTNCPFFKKNCNLWSPNSDDIRRHTSISTCMYRSWDLNKLHSKLDTPNMMTVGTATWTMPKKLYMQRLSSPVISPCDLHSDLHSFMISLKLHTHIWFHR